MKNLELLLVLYLSIQFILLPSNGYTGANRETLKAVQILFRHGDRTPDIGDMIGLGRITDKGKKEAFDLGLFLRDRYNDFLPLEYSPDDITLISSDSDRTIQSASLVAYGLYRNFNLAATWADPEQVQYDPIPVRHIPKQEDKYLQYGKSCPRWDQLYQEAVGKFTYDFIVENPDVIEIYTTRKDNVSLFDPHRSITSRIDPLIAFQDEILYNMTHGSPVEDWALELINIPNFFALFNNFEEIHQKKMTLYCGHDKTLFTLMVTLGIEDKQVMLLPPTASVLMIELHQNLTSVEGGEPYLEIWYRNSTSSEPYHLTIPECGKPCYFSKVKDMKKEVIPLNFESECLNTPSQPEIANSQNSWLLLWVGAVMIVVVFGMVLCMTKSKSRIYDKI
ncbi:unnamed protein product [Allacma fusca]|uniref:Acid phosphatase n=1 Tax=Allacma fusca TaxID=39272 RepID=A0A8J2KPB7_9HEXA|nr:unnamed protein product [Allacma fusca]